jgi:hypothetical protein
VPDDVELVAVDDSLLPLPELSDDDEEAPSDEDGELADDAVRDDDPRLSVL